MTLGHIIFLVVFFIHFTGVQMSSQVLEAKKGQKISVEIKKNLATIYANRASISGVSDVNLDLMMKSSLNLLKSSLDFSVTKPRL